MKAADLISASLCAAWLLALLWISVPEHDLLAALWSQTMAAWVQAIGSIAAVGAAVLIALTEVRRAARANHELRRDLFQTLREMVEIAREDALRLRSAALLRHAMGIHMSDSVADYNQRARRLSATLERIVSGRTFEIGLLLLVGDFLDVLLFRFDGDANPLLVEADADRIVARLDDIEAKLIAGGTPRSADR